MAAAARSTRPRQSGSRPAAPKCNPRGRPHLGGPAIVGGSPPPTHDGTALTAADNAAGSRVPVATATPSRTSFRARNPSGKWLGPERCAASDAGSTPLSEMRRIGENPAGYLLSRGEGFRKPAGLPPVTFRCGRNPIRGGFVMGQSWSGDVSQGAPPRQRRPFVGHREGTGKVGRPRTTRLASFDLDRDLGVKMEAEHWN